MGASNRSRVESNPSAVRTSHNVTPRGSSANQVNSNSRTRHINGDKAMEGVQTNKRKSQEEPSHQYVAQRLKKQY